MSSDLVSHRLFYIACMCYSAMGKGGGVVIGYDAGYCCYATECEGVMMILVLLMSS